MKCDIPLLTGLVTAINILLMATQFALGGAIAANASIFLAWTATGFIITAAATSLAALLLVIKARTHIASQCTACSGQSSAILKTLDTLTGTLTAYTAGLAITLLTGLLPVVGGIAIVASMVILATIINSVTDLTGGFINLNSCANTGSPVAANVIVGISLLFFYFGTAYILLTILPLIPGTTKK